MAALKSTGFAIGILVLFLTILVVAIPAFLILLTWAWGFLEPFWEDLVDTLKHLWEISGP